MEEEEWRKERMVEEKVEEGKGREKVGKGKRRGRESGS